jgi:hypothetical protein
MLNGTFEICISKAVARFAAILKQLGDAVPICTDFPTQAVRSVAPTRPAGRSATAQAALDAARRRWFGAAGM